MSNSKTFTPTPPPFDLKPEFEELMPDTAGGNVIAHNKILERLLEQLTYIDFREQAGIDTDDKLQKKHFLVCAIEHILNIAHSNNWSLCRNADFIYIYNGAYWSNISSEEMQLFLGMAAEKIGVEKFDARHYVFREQLYKQFLATAHMPKPEPPDNAVFVNLKNGTFEISQTNRILRAPDKADFITYQLPFEYNSQAKAPMFEAYLNRVQPDKANQAILAEYAGYLFIKNNTLKLEKTLLLYGSGANGKSVFFDTITAILGNENVSEYSLQSLTDGNGYFRAMLLNKLLNYSSEISTKLNSAIFKQLVSGEPVEARLPHCKPFTLSNYARMIFNCNDLPKDVEHNEAYFRRFLIIPFDVTIPEHEQDKELSKKIITSELSGVFNWILQGLERLLKNKRFTHSESSSHQLEEYKKQSDNVSLFLEEEAYTPSTAEFILLKEFYNEYKDYCKDSGFYACSVRTLSERLRKLGYFMERKKQGNVVFAERQNAGLV